LNHGDEFVGTRVSVSVLAGESEKVELDVHHMRNQDSEDCSIVKPFVSPLSGKDIGNITIFVKKMQEERIYL
jgi:hypothetical protein